MIVIILQYQMWSCDDKCSSFPVEEKSKMAALVVNNDDQPIRTRDCLVCTGDLVKHSLIARLQPHTFSFSIDPWPSKHLKRDHFPKCNSVKSEKWLKLKKWIPPQMDYITTIILFEIVQWFLPYHRYQTPPRCTTTRWLHQLELFCRILIPFHQLATNITTNIPIINLHRRHPITCPSSRDSLNTMRNISITITWNKRTRNQTWAT